MQDRRIRTGVTKSESKTERTESCVNEAVGRLQAM